MKAYFIQDREFSKSELELWAWKRLKEAPGWEKSHLLFVLQWLSGTAKFAVHTSGSTGAPKQITLSRATMEASARLSAQYFNLPAGSTALLALPSTFVAGKMMLVRALVNGWHLHWNEPSATPQLSSGWSFDFAAFTPMQALGLWQLNPEIFQSIKKVLLGGAPVSAHLQSLLRQAGNLCFESYGMTETASHVALRPLNGPEASAFFTALPGITFGQNEEQCLVIHAGALHLDTLVTRDVVRLINPTQFAWLGRADHVINSGGIKIHPEAVEQKLAPHLSQRFYIASLPDEQLGQKAVLVLEGVMNDKEREALRQSLKPLLQSYELPREVLCLEKFEETSSGKVKRIV